MNKPIRIIKSVPLLEVGAVVEVSEYNCERLVGLGYAVELSKEEYEEFLK